MRQGGCQGWGAAPPGAPRRALALTQEPRALHCEPLKEGAATAEGQVQAGRSRVPTRAASLALGGSPGRCASAATAPAGWRSHATDRSAAIRTAPWGAERGERKQWHGQSAAAPVPSFSAPWGADREGKAQRLFERVAAPTGGRKWPGSPAVCGGCPAVALYQRLHRPVRGRLRRQAYLRDSLCASRCARRRRAARGKQPCRAERMGVSHRACPPLPAVALGQGYYRKGRADSEEAGGRLAVYKHPDIAQRFGDGPTYPQWRYLTVIKQVMGVGKQEAFQDHCVNTAMRLNPTFAKQLRRSDFMVSGATLVEKAERERNWPTRFRGRRRQRRSLPWPKGIPPRACPTWRHMSRRARASHLVRKVSARGARALEGGAPQGVSVVAECVSSSGSYRTRQESLRQETHS